MSKNFGRKFRALRECRLDQHFFVGAIFLKLGKLKGEYWIVTFDLDSSIIYVLLHDYHQVVIICYLKVQSYRAGKIHKIRVVADGFSIFPNQNRSTLILMFVGSLQ